LKDFSDWALHWNSPWPVVWTPLLLCFPAPSNSDKFSSVEFNSSEGCRVFSKLPLTALKTFEAAARLSSFKLAAAELAVSPSAVSHQIKTLEQWLGQRLFERVAKGTLLTPTGSALFSQVHGYFLGLDRALEQYRPPQWIKSISSSPPLRRSPHFG
jgi:hypothetical protein